MLARTNPWQGRKYLLDKMSLNDLLVAFFTHYSIQIYLLLAVIAVAFAATYAPGWREPVFAGLTVLALYPLAEYALHRWCCTAGCCIKAR